MSKPRSVTSGEKIIVHKGRLKYKVSNGQVIDVLYWHKWPSYDFIFGIPDKNNRFRKVEAGFFQYRDRRARKVKCGFYIDKRELDILIQGFKKIKKVNPHA